MYSIRFGASMTKFHKHRIDSSILKKKFIMCNFTLNKITSVLKVQCNRIRKYEKTCTRTFYRYFKKYKNKKKCLSNFIGYLVAIFMSSNDLHQKEHSAII